MVVEVGDGWTVGYEEGCEGWDCLPELVGLGCFLLRRGGRRDARVLEWPGTMLGCIRTAKHLHHPSSNHHLHALML